MSTGQAVLPSWCPVLQDRTKKEFRPALPLARTGNDRTAGQDRTDELVLYMSFLLQFTYFL